MGLNLFDRIQAKIELFRLEQRYTRRRNRRSTFVSNAIYVDGEYIYQSPNTTGSSSATTSTSSRTNSNSNSMTSPTTMMPAAASPTTEEPPAVATKAQKRLNRWSSMPGFGGSMSGRHGSAATSPTSVSTAAGHDWRTTGVQQQRRSFNDVR